MKGVLGNEDRDVIGMHLAMASINEDIVADWKKN
jgi:hypothetical protein